MENAIDQYPETKELLVFYFAEGDYGRMGTHHAYALGIDENKKVWRSSGPCYGYINDPDGFAKSHTPFNTSQLTIESRIIEMLLGDKDPVNWERNEECYAGMGNHGLCFGKMVVPVVYHHD